MTKNEEIRKKILNSARTVFQEKGYTKATISEIARVAAVSPSTIYSYFKGKQELFDTLCLDDYYKSYQPDYEKKRQEIVQAALLMFGEQGYSATTLESIMKKVNMSTATVYNYFPSKDSLFAAVLEAGQVKMVVHQLDVDGESITDPNSLINNIGTAYLKMGHEPTRSAIFKIMLQEGKSLPDIAKLYYQTTKSSSADILSKHLKRFQQQGLIRKDLDTRLASLLMQFMFWGYTIMYNYIGIDAEFSEEDVLRHAREIIINGLKG